MALSEVNGTSLYHETVGTGTTALVLHGGLGIDHTAYRTLDPLAAHLRLVYYDHRGNGRSSRVDPDSLTMEGWADDAIALAGETAGPEPVVLIGHSYGGFVAQEAAIRHGAAVRALVLITTTPGQLGTGEEPAPEGPPIPPELVELLAALPETDEEVGEGMAGLAPAYLHATPPDALLAAMAGTRFSAVAMRRGFEELAGWSSVDRLAQVRAPALVVAGRHDAFTSWPQSERIASRLPDAEMVVFEDSAHFPWLEEPDAFFATVVGWLRRKGIVT